MNAFGFFLGGTRLSPPIVRRFELESSNLQHACSTHTRTSTDEANRFAEGANHMLRDAGDELSGTDQASTGRSRISGDAHNHNLLLCWILWEWCGSIKVSQNRLNKTPERLKFKIHFFQTHSKTNAFLFSECSSLAYYISIPKKYS